MLSTPSQTVSQYVNYYINLCFHGIRYQKRRKRKCWETGGWASEKKLGYWEDEAKQAWLGLGPRETTQNHCIVVHRGAWLRGQVGAKILPKPQSLDKLSLYWQQH